MNYQTYHDILTGLPNRLLFEELFHAGLTCAQSRERMLVILILDVDRFKLINDNLGHHTGDNLLKEVTKRLKECIQDGDSIVRLNGDQFVLILTDISDKQSMEYIANKIITTLSNPFYYREHEIFISTGIGISYYPDHGDHIEMLLRKADTAMHHAKEKGKNHYQFFSADMNMEPINQILLENSLRNALNRSQFIVHYQPQVELSTGKICGVEALVRWNHPDKGMVSPLEFIPLAEKTGLIVPLGEWVLRTACYQTKAWQEQGFSLKRVSVNLSAYQFENSDMVQVITDILKETKLSPFCLELEITETIIIKDIQATIESLKKLKSLGVRISVDDFGTGYSSLNYLKILPIDTLKIDQSFVQEITSGSRDAAIVSSIIILAHKLQLKVIAEGVETQEQLNILKHEKCDEIQGYLISKPLPSNELEKIYQQDYVTI